MRWVDSGTRRVDSGTRWVDSGTRWVDSGTRHIVNPSDCQSPHIVNPSDCQSPHSANLECYDRGVDDKGKSPVPLTESTSPSAATHTLME
eukprot:7194676-Pyramimonas_sp.AAC.1